MRNHSATSFDIDMTLAMYHTLDRHCTQASYPIQPETTSLAVIRACLAATTASEIRTLLNMIRLQNVPTHDLKSERAV